jgi:hypothetical protein
MKKKSTRIYTESDVRQFVKLEAIGGVINTDQYEYLVTHLEKWDQELRALVKIEESDLRITKAKYTLARRTTQHAGDMEIAPIQTRLAKLEKRRADLRPRIAELRENKEVNLALQYKTVLEEAINLIPFEGDTVDLHVRARALLAKRLPGEAAPKNMLDDVEIPLASS